MLRRGAHPAHMKWLFDFTGEISEGMAQHVLRLWTATSPFDERENFLGIDVRLMAYELVKYIEPASTG